MNHCALQVNLLPQALFEDHQETVPAFPTVCPLSYQPAGCAIQSYVPTTSDTCMQQRKHSIFIYKSMNQPSPKL